MMVTSGGEKRNNYRKENKPSKSAAENNFGQNRQGLPSRFIQNDRIGPLYQIWCFYLVNKETSPKPPDKHMNQNYI